MSSPINVGVVLFGVGGVGRALITQVVKTRPFHLKRYNVNFDVLAVVDSSGFVANEGKPLSDEVLEAASQWKAASKAMKTFESANVKGAAGTAEEALKFMSAKSIAVDCSATDSITSVLVKALESGNGVALANKKPLTVDQASFNAMTTPSNLRRLKYESSVGAGTPMVASLWRLLNSGDTVHKIQGTFSGTLGYVMTGLGAGEKYSDVVAEALAKGYTEPDPRDDLGGVDVGRKALIMARTLGFQLEMKDVQITPLYTPKYDAMPKDEFIAKIKAKDLPDLDEKYTAEYEEAAKTGKVLRYVATIEITKDGPKCVVGLEHLSADSPIGRLVGTDNMVEFYTQVYGDKPLVLQGAGAGGEVTACGVLGDMVELVSAL